MTCGVGTKSIPKDYKFENILRMNLSTEKFDKIIYYDTCIIAKPNKVYGKVIISNDCIYSYVDHGKTFSVLAEFKDIYSIELLNDIPQFIIGPMRNDCVHVKLLFFQKKSTNRKKQIKEKSSTNKRICCYPYVKESKQDSLDPLLYTSQNEDIESTNADSQNNDYTIGDNVMTQNSTNVIDSRILDSVDFYILNKYSPIMTLLKKSYVDYLIHETLQYSSSDLPIFHLNQTLINNLFDGLIFDISSTTNSIDSHRNFLLELIRSGYKYTRIKMLFWAKPNLFEFLVEQFIGKLRDLFLNDQPLEYLHETLTMKSQKKESINACLDSVNLFIKMFNIFFSGTDHFYSKWEKLRKNNAKYSLLLTENIFRLVSYLNNHDRCDSPENDSSKIDVDIDYTKHQITINSIQLFYNLICSSQVTFNNDDETNSFTIRSISHLIESFISYEDNEAIFNSFINQILRMIFIWLFPKIYKLTDQFQLSSQQVVSIYQFFSSLKIIVHCIPKILEILRKEMKEEFSHFELEEITFSDNYPLSEPTFRLLKSFQKNITNYNQIFID